MHAPQRRNRAGRPRIQRTIVHVIENRNEVQDETRLLVVSRRADLEAGGDFIELGEPVFGVDDRRNESAGAPDSADGAEKPVGDVGALLLGAHRLFGFDLERLAEVVGTGRRGRRGHLGNVDCARSVPGAEPVIVMVRRLQPAPDLFAKIPVDLVGIGGLEVEGDQRADVEPVGGGDTPPIVTVLHLVRGAARQMHWRWKRRKNGRWLCDRHPQALPGASGFRSSMQRLYRKASV